MSIVAIIPARGGSKRIPGKNIKLFAGLPMIAHPIRTARAAGVFNRIIVSTDSEAVAAVARDHGAETPFMRPAELANDLVPTDSVMVHALEWLGTRGELPDCFCCIYPTSLFLRAEYIRQGLELLRARQATVAFSVTTFPYPIFRAMKVNDRGRMEMFWPENRHTRSQDLPEAFHDAAQFYWADTAKYMREQRLLSNDGVPVFIPRWLVQDIDTPEDWEVAERVFRDLQVGTLDPGAEARHG